MAALRTAAFLTFRSVTHGHKAATGLIIFILSLSFVNLVFVTSILRGIVDTMNNQVKNNLTAQFVVEPQEEPVRKTGILHTADMRSLISRIPGVIATSSHYKIDASFGYDKENSGRFKYVPTQAIGIDPHEEKSVTGIFRHLVSGRYLDNSDNGSIVLGSDLAGGYGGDEMQSLGGVKVGQKVRITCSNGAVRFFTVKGIFKTRFGMIDILAFINAKEAEAMLSTYDNASQILIKTDPSRPDDYYLKRIRALDPRLPVRNWVYFMGGLGGISQSFDMIGAVVGMIGLVVAAITVFIIVYVNAVNKRRQIGILKAIGIGREVVILSFVFQALFFSLCGIALGAALIFGVLAPFFAKHPLDVAAGDVMLTVPVKTLVTSIVSLAAAAVIAGFFPAWRVAKTNILKAIWGN